MIELTRMPQTASMQDIKNRTSEVTDHLANGPVLLMNRATPQAVVVSVKQWDTIVERMEEMQDAIITLQAELAIATGESQVETIDDPDAFLQEMMVGHESLSA